MSAIRLYLSQANQLHNPGPNGYNERAGMDAITAATAAVFAKDSRFLVKRTKADRVDTASENGAEANAWGADYYVALHSNAGGPGARGTFGYYYSRASKGYALAAAIVERLSPLSPGAGKALIAMPGFIELHTPHMPACLIEVEAHDWAEGVKFLTGQRPAIAKAIYEGICSGLGLKPVSAPVEVDYRPLKKAAVAVAVKLHIDRSGVDVNAAGKGPAFEALLRKIAEAK